MLEGLKEIAAVLEREWGYTVSVWRVWRYSMSSFDPLPCRRVARLLRADLVELVDWARRQPRYRSQGGALVIT
jgi:hypothetical protein